MLSLSTTQLFEQDIAGTYEISLRGPLGRDAIFSIAIVPVLHLSMNQVEVVRLPDSKGTFSSPQLTITTSDGLLVDSSDTGVHIEAKPHSHYTALIPASSTEVELALYSKKKTSSIKIPLMVPLPIIHWMVVDAQNAFMGSDWQTKEITYPGAWLEQVESPRLLVSLALAKGTSLQLFQRLHPSCGRITLSLLSSLSNPPVEVRHLLKVLLNEVSEAFPHPFILVLDDLHTLTDPHTVEVSSTLDKLIYFKKPSLQGQTTK